MPVIMKMNCWEYMECGREPAGKNADELGICPVTVAVIFDGINNGTCAGRICWHVAGTLCRGEVQGTFAAKIRDCVNCPFFQEVARQEGKSLVFTKDIGELFR
jgi:hypothetical protein